MTSVIHHKNSVMSFINLVGGIGMSEKIEVKITYELDERLVKKHMVETGEYLHITKKITISLEKFPKDVRELICDWYFVSKDGVRIDMKDADRVKYAALSSTTIQVFEEEQQEESMIKEVSWFVRTREEYKNRPNIRKIEKSNCIRIGYYTSPAFRERELLQNKKILNYRMEVFIDISDLEEDVLAFVGNISTIEHNNKIDNLVLNIAIENDYYEEGMYPISTYITKQNVNDFLRWYHKKHKEINDSYKREKEKSSETTTKHEKEKWIEEYGSSYLQRATKLDYNCQRLYVEERVKQEFPNWTLDFDNKLSVRERSLPSEAALDVEERMRKQHPQIDIRIYWKKEGTGGKELVVIRNYLGKYTLYQEII